MKAILAALAFAAAPALAEDVLCGDVAFVTPESIAFVATLKGLEPPPPPRTDIKPALEAEGGMIWIISGPEPSEAVRSCLSTTEQRVPGVAALYKDLLNGIGKPPSPEALAARLRPFPEEMHSTLLAQGFAGPIGSHGQRIEAGPWASFVQVTSMEEPLRSLQTIGTLLGAADDVPCHGAKTCLDAFTDFIAE